ncbi:hypothetical protein BKA56DRAFT_601611 [Ilyonectria sp. MPI-CAGE-AT-0026]|nr:hypothetical protein BKA56DRAFT_601611 [Ilyonectria sp. MPI-CAGE-AT-0026]
MQLSSAILVTLATAASAQDYLATIYPSRGYSGPSLRIYDEECVRLRQPFRSRIGSIKITEDTYCEFYTTNSCLLSLGWYYGNFQSLSIDAPIGSVRCGFKDEGN